MRWTLLRSRCSETTNKGEPYCSNRSAIGTSSMASIHAASSLPPNLFSKPLRSGTMAGLTHGFSPTVCPSSLSFIGFFLWHMPSAPFLLLAHSLQVLPAVHDYRFEFSLWDYGLHRVAYEQHPGLRIGHFAGDLVQNQLQKQQRQVAPHAHGKIDPGRKAGVDLDQLVSTLGVTHHLHLQRSAPVDGADQRCAGVVQGLVEDTDTSPGLALVGHRHLLHHYFTEHVTAAVAHRGEVVLLTLHQPLHQHRVAPLCGNFPECVGGLVGAVDNAGAVEQSLHYQRIAPALLLAVVEEAHLAHAFDFRALDAGVIGQLWQAVLVAQLQLPRCGHKVAYAHFVELRCQSHHARQLGVQAGYEDIDPLCLMDGLQAGDECLIAGRGVGQQVGRIAVLPQVKARVQGVIAQPDNAAREFRGLFQAARHTDARAGVVWPGIHAGDRYSGCRRHGGQSPMNLRSIPENSTTSRSSSRALTLYSCNNSLSSSGRSFSCCRWRRISNPVSLTVKWWPLTGSNTNPLSLTARRRRDCAEGRIALESPDWWCSSMHAEPPVKNRWRYCITSI